MMRRFKVLVWDGHASYLHALFQCPHDFFLIVKNKSARQPENVHAVLAGEVRTLDLDLILFQERAHFLKDRLEILTFEQRQLPMLYLEHDLPRNLMDPRHFIDDPAIPLVHVTYFNDLLWNCGQTPTQVIDHGVLLPPGVHYKGGLPRGLVIADHLKMGGWHLGEDIYQRVRREVPLDLVGIRSEDVEGGLPGLPEDQIPAFASHYRFLFEPSRYASLSLSVCQMMMMGMPVVALATSEMPTVIRSGVSGYIHLEIPKLIKRMKELIQDPSEAHRLGRGAYRYAHERFNNKRFIREWNEIFDRVCKPSISQYRQEVPV